MTNISTASILWSLFQPTSPIVSSGLGGILSDAYTKTKEVGGNTLAGMVLGVTPPHRILTPMKMAFSFFFPGQILMAGEGMIRNGYKILTTLPQIPWLFTSSANTSESLNDGIVQGAKAALKDEEEVFWTNAPNKKHKSAWQGIFSNPTVTAHQLGQWSKGSTAENLASLRPYISSDTQRGEMLTALYANSSQLNTYLNVKRGLEASLVGAQANSKVLKRTSHLRSDAIQVAGHRSKVKWALVGIAFASTIATLGALTALGARYATVFEGPNGFAQNVMGQSLDNATGFCDAAAASSAASSWIGNSSILGYGYWGVQEWVMPTIGPALLALNLGSAFMRGRKEGFKTSIYTLATSFHMGMLPESIGTALGGIGYYGIYGAFGLFAIPHMVGKWVEGYRHLDQGNFSGFMGSVFASLEPMKIGAMTAGLVHYGSQLSGGLRILAHSVTRSFNCAILANMLPR